MRLDEDGNLVIPPLSAEDIPSEADELKDELTALVPFAPIASVFIELDRRTGFLDCFTHAGGAKPRSRELKRNLIAVLIALSTNLGIARTADACGIGYDTLAWTQEWYVREETLRAANLVLIDYHQQLPLTPSFGSGTLSSSDGQRFPTKGKSITARALSRYFADEGVSTYTHITDQHIVYGTKVIVAPTGRRPACWMRFWVTWRICRSPSTLLIRTGLACSTLPCSIFAGCGCPRGSAISGRSSSTAPHSAAKCARPIRWLGHC